MLTASDCLCTQAELTATFEDCDAIELGDVQLAFDSEVCWDLDSICFEFACWISHEHSGPASTSRVGILSSAKFEILLDNIISRDLRRAFRILSETSSVLYNHEGDTNLLWKGYSPAALTTFRSFAGTLVLQHLEKALNNHALARYSLRELKVMFLIIFGTIIAVGYSKSVSPTCDVSIVAQA